MNNLYAFGIGIGTKNNTGEWLEVFYPEPMLAPSDELAAILVACLGSHNGDIEPSQEALAALISALLQNGYNQLAETVTALKASSKPVVAIMLSTDAAPLSVPQGYLKLHLLSHRLVKPHQTNISGIFGVLKNIAWTNVGAIDIKELPDRVLAARIQGTPLQVDCVDKFPKMVDYIVPTGVRIADTSRVRLGAYVGEGTTVMHEGFINFNAGTEGPAMIEGRISAGVMVGANSDLGGGCSTMGTLSGGGKQVISVGENCLIGANAGIGIPLANGCVVEAGLYVTAGTKVQLLNAQGELKRNCKAMDLVGHEGLLFRRNSLSGAVECLPLQSEVELNEELHAHN